MSNHDFKDDIYDEHMGLMTSYRWAHDPKTVLFVLSRYKFVSKMLEGYNRVLEVGCGDGFGSRLVRQSVNHLCGLDIDDQMIEDAKKRNSKEWPIDYQVGNINEQYCEQGQLPYFKYLDAVYALDVLEHIPRKEEDVFIDQAASLAPIVIIGMPSLESQPYASPLSAANHINCKSSPELKSLMKEYFSHVFMFSMNDEVVSTGFHKLAHYIFAIGVR